MNGGGGGDSKTRTNIREKRGLRSPKKRENSAIFCTVIEKRNLTPCLMSVGGVRNRGFQGLGELFR